MNKKKILWEKLYSYYTGFFDLIFVCMMMTMKKKSADTMFFCSEHFFFLLNILIVENRLKTISHFKKNSALRRQK